MWHQIEPGSLYMMGMKDRLYDERKAKEKIRKRTEMRFR